MIILHRQDTDIYLFSRDITELSVNRKTKEAKVKYQVGAEISYFDIVSVDVNVNNQ